MTPSKIRADLQAIARDQGRPVDEILTLYALERFLARLGSSPYAQDFCLKGGVLLSAHSLRRPTRDIDMQALDFNLDVDHVTEVVTKVSELGLDDGLTFQITELKIEQIREEHEYSGLRVSLPTKLGRAKLTIKLDISTGDPIWPKPEPIELPGLLGDSVKMLGHPLETVIAEKTVTMLQRGITSTRWRDLVDVASISSMHSFVAADVRQAAAGVADHRGVELKPIRPLLEGYGENSQLRWTAWRQKHQMEDRCEQNLDDQVKKVVSFIDPVFDLSAKDHDTWNPGLGQWS